MDESPPLAVVCLSYLQYLTFIRWKNLPEDRAVMITSRTGADEYLRKFGPPDKEHLVVLPCAHRPQAIIAILHHHDNKRGRG